MKQWKPATTTDAVTCDPIPPPTPSGSSACRECGLSVPHRHDRLGFPRPLNPSEFFPYAGNGWDDEKEMEREHDERATRLMAELRAAYERVGARIVSERLERWRYGESASAEPKESERAP